MTRAELQTMLSSITGFSGKVAYRAFPVGNAPSLPFITFLEEGENDFSADGITYHAAHNYVVELYTENRDETSEAAVAAALTNAGVYYRKDIFYLEDEHCFMIEYHI